MTIGTKIRNAREDMDYTQLQMAQLIPMNQSNYSKIERDLQEPNLYQLKRIVELLCLDIYDLLEIDIDIKYRNNDRRFLNEIIALYQKMYP